MPPSLGPPLFNGFSWHFLLVFMPGAPPTGYERDGKEGGAWKERVGGGGDEK